MTQPSTRDLRTVLEAVGIVRAELRFHAKRLEARADTSVTPDTYTELGAEYGRAERTLSRLQRHLHNRVAREQSEVPRTRMRHDIPPTSIDAHGRAIAFVTDASPQDDDTNPTE